MITNRNFGTRSYKTPENLIEKDLDFYVSMDKERKEVLKMLNSFQYDQELRGTIVRTKRNLQESEKMRRMGNDQFQKEFHSKRSHSSAWQLYTISVVAAEPNSEALAMAYGNRSAILIHLCKYKECIEDIDRALSITNNNVLRIKLLIRKSKSLYCLDTIECHKVLKKAAFLTNQIVDEPVKMGLQDNVEKTRILLKKKNGSVAKVDKKSKLLDALVKKHQINNFSLVEINFSEQYGRHLVATKDMRPGDIIFIEKPFIRCLNLGSMHAFCSYCFNLSWTNISCDNCSWCMFCSTECKEKAWEEYHDIECDIYACAKAKGNGTPQQLALRAIILGLKEYGSLENFKIALDAFDECTDINEAFMQDGKIKPSGLMAMYSLSRKISKRSLKRHEEELVRILKSVGFNTTWFGSNFDHTNPSSYKQNESVALFATMFLTFSKIGQINGRQMWNHRSNPCYENPGVMLCPPKEECCSAGSYLAPVTSLLNHSCFPNARVCYGSNNTVIVYATQPIKKGDQIFDCYSLQYHEEDITKRRKILSKTYNLQCDCIACQEQWPFGEKLTDLCDRKLKNCSLEGVLFQKNSKFILPDNELSTHSMHNRNYKETTIGILRDDIEKALRRIPQPSFTTVSLMHTLQTVMEQIYGISIDVPEKCNNI